MSHSDILSTDLPQDFCLALKEARERKGITLAEIAETTKIPASVFAALERNDLRCWPKGLFKRSFFRDYVGMIGLPVTEACEAFVRLFPDEESVEAAKAAEPQPRRSMLEGFTIPPAIGAAWQRAAAAISLWFAKAEDEASEGVRSGKIEAPAEPRKWTSDARRVGPAPRIRVRIKVSR
ncbi:MAG TPA: helix-turn-helix domain-containing protein [Vicinamibacterales bacterium]|nr:helix-turn-helix domain-containing protein [Vicinamibacterales bacterium]